MLYSLLQYRTCYSTDWITILFLISFGTIAVTRTVFATRFADFSKLIYSDKYHRNYRDGYFLKSIFTIVLFLLQTISFSLLLLIAASYFGIGSKTDFILFIRICTGLIYFILAKFLVDKILAEAFDIDEILQQFTYSKILTRNYIAIILLPFNFVFIYNDYLSKDLFIILLSAVLLSCAACYLVALKNLQSVILPKIFYFILYLCALELGPYYFIYYWLTKGIA